MTQIDDTCPGCDIHLTVAEWEIEDGRLHCPNCGWSQLHKQETGS